MKEHYDATNRLSIELDSDVRNFQIYADRLKEKLKARLVQKLDFDDLRCWAFDLDGVMVELYWDEALGQEVLIRMMDEENVGFLRAVAEKIATK